MRIFLYDANIVASFSARKATDPDRRNHRSIV